MTLNKLKSRAMAHDMMIRKERNGGYWLLDIYTNGVVAPGPMTLEEAVLTAGVNKTQAQQKN